MLDLARNFGRLSMLGANALMIVALAAFSALWDDTPRNAAEAAVAENWHAPLVITTVESAHEDSRYVPRWMLAR